MIDQDESGESRIESTGDRLLAAICKNPDDDLPRAAYADWLDENGPSARADFIRIQLALSQMPRWDERRPALENREHRLLTMHESTWCHGVDRTCDDWSFSRGFLDWVSGPWEEIESLFQLGEPLTSASILVNHQDDLLKQTEFLHRLKLVTWRRDDSIRLTHLINSLIESPTSAIRSLVLSYRPELSKLARLLARIPWRNQLESLAFGGRSYSMFDWGHAAGETIDAIALTQVLAGAPLKWLSAHDCGLTADGVARFLNAWSGTLTDFNISNNHLEPQTVSAFQNSRARLRKLDVSGTVLANSGMAPLLQTACLRELRQLDANGVGNARDNLAGIADSPFWTQAEWLSLHHGTIPARHFEPLVLGPGPPALRNLFLGGNYLRSEGVRMLCDAAWSGSLVSLDLSDNYLENDALDAIAGCGKFTRLRSLYLGGNNIREDDPDESQITDTGVRALTRSDSLNRLRDLGLSDAAIEDDTVDRVLNQSPWRLDSLNLARCNLTPRVVDILIESPALARLTDLNLSSNPRLSGDELKRLAECPLLSRLCRLDLSGCYVDQSTIHRFRERLGPRLSV
jgi:uncharacterized protein (TIGR02996 family)